MKRLSKYLIFTAIIMMCSAQSLIAESLEKITFVKLSPPDQKAVIKTPDGKLQMVGIGDMVGDDNRIAEISKDRVVLEKMSQAGVETIIVTLHNGKQKIQKISKAAGKKQPLASAAAQAEKSK
jgi:hypothetical protein